MEKELKAVAKVSQRGEPKPLIYDLPEGFDRAEFDRQYAAIRQLDLEMLDLLRAVESKKRAIDDAWNALPPTVSIREPRYCMKCQELTLHRFGGLAICNKHIAIKGDKDVVSILDDLING